MSKFVCFFFGEKLRATSLTKRVFFLPCFHYVSDLVMGSYSEVEFVERGPSFTLRFHWMYCWHNIIYAGKEEIDKFYTSKKGIQFIIRHRVF